MQRSGSAAPPQTLTSAVKNVVTALRKLLCALKLTADQELRQKQRLRSLFSELDRSSSGRPGPYSAHTHAPGHGHANANGSGVSGSPNASPLSASPISPSSPSSVLSPSSPSALALKALPHPAPAPAPAPGPHPASPALPAPSPIRTQSPQRLPYLAAAPLLPPPNFPAPSPPSPTHSQAHGTSASSVATASLALPLAPQPSAPQLAAAPKAPPRARRSSRARSYDRLIARLAEDCRVLTVELKPTAAEFRERAFADALAALLATHRSAVGILTVYLGSGSALKRLLVAGTALDMAANEVVIHAAPPAPLYAKARHNFKICLKDFLATIRASTLLLSAAASPRTTEQTTPATAAAAVAPSSASRYTLTPPTPPSPAAASSATPGAGKEAVREEAARKGQIQRVSSVAQSVIKALRGPLSADFVRTFDFGIVQELLKALATLLSSLRVEDRAVRMQLVEATKALVAHSKRLKGALDARSVEEFVAAKAPFLTALKSVLTTLLTLARQKP